MSKFPRLVVSGTHSSGKNYTSRILYELGFPNFLQEPLSPLSPPGIWLGNKGCIFTYCDTRSPAAKQALIKRKLFQPTGLPVFATPATLRDYAALWRDALIRIGLWYSGGSFVMKDPFGLFAADFLKSGCGIAPWIIIRHPADFIANSLRTATPFDFGSLEADSEFEERLAGEFRELRTYASHPDHQTLFHQNLVYWMICAHFSLRYADEWAISSRYAFNLLDSINADPEGRIGLSLQRCGFHVAKHDLAAALERVSSPQHVKDLRKLQQSAETLNKPDPKQRLNPLTPSMIGEVERMTSPIYTELEKLETALSGLKPCSDRLARS